ATSSRISVRLAEVAYLFAQVYGPKVLAGQIAASAGPAVAAETPTAPATPRMAAVTTPITRMIVDVIYVPSFDLIGCCEVLMRQPGPLRFPSGLTVAVVRVNGLRAFCLVLVTALSMRWRRPHAGEAGMSVEI